MNTTKENAKTTRQRVSELDERAYQEVGLIQRITSVLLLLREAIEEDDLVRYPAAQLLIDLMDTHRENFIDLTDELVALFEEENK